MKLIAAIGIYLVTPVVAYAQGNTETVCRGDSPTGEGYGGTAGRTIVEIDCGGLPFSGLDILLLAGCGVLLFVTGVILFRRGKKQIESS